MNISKIVLLSLSLVSSFGAFALKPFNTDKYFPNKYNNEFSIIHIKQGQEFTLCLPIPFVNASWLITRLDSKLLAFVDKNISTVTESDYSEIQETQYTFRAMNSGRTIIELQELTQNYGYDILVIIE
jgi:hypothetical protein